MEKVIAYNEKMNTKLVVDVFKQKDFVFKCGESTYRVYKDNQFVFQSTNLFIAFLWFRNPSFAEMPSYKMKDTILIYNSRRCKHKKIFGIYDDLGRCANIVYDMIDCFTTKSVDKEKARLNWLLYIFDEGKNVQIDSTLLPYLEVKVLHFNEMMERDTKTL